MRAIVVALVVLASARSGAANESPRVPVAASDHNHSTPHEEAEHHNGEEKPHSPVSLLAIAGGGGGILPHQHQLSLVGELELGLEVEVHIGRFKGVAEVAVTVNSRFQAALALAAMAVLHRRVAIGVGGVAYLGLESSADSRFNELLIGPAIDVAITRSVQVMCLPGAMGHMTETAESGGGRHLVWGVGVSCHAAFLIAGGGHSL